MTRLQRRFVSGPKTALLGAHWHASRSEPCPGGLGFANDPNVIYLVVGRVCHARHRDQVEAPLTDWLREAYEVSEAAIGRAPKKSADGCDDGAEKKEAQVMGRRRWRHER